MERPSDFGNLMVTKRKALSSVRGRPRTVKNGPVTKSLGEDAKAALVSIICNYTGGYLFNGYHHSLKHPAMKNGLNGVTQGSNGISIAHKESLLDYVKKHGKVKNEPASPVKKVKKRVSFGPSTVKIFSELDYFSGEKAMLQEIARKQRIRDIKKSLRNNHKKDNNAVVVTGRRSSFRHARTQIRKQSPTKSKKTALKKPLSLHKPNHVVNNVSDKDKKEEATGSGKDDGTSNERDQREQKRHQHPDTPKTKNSDGKDSHQDSKAPNTSKNSCQERSDNAPQKTPAQGSGKPLNDSTTSVNKACNILKNSVVMVRLQKVTASQLNDACKALADFPSKATVERKEAASQLPREATAVLSKVYEIPACASDHGIKRTRGRPRKEFRQERVRKYSSRGRPRKGSVPEVMKVCTSLNEGSGVCAKTDSKECPSRPCLSRVCKEPKDKAPSAAKEDGKTSDKASKSPKDASQLEIRSSVRKLHPKSASLGKRVSSKPSDLCKKIPGKKISPKASKHCQKKAGTSSISSKEKATGEKGNAGKAAQASKNPGNAGGTTQPLKKSSESFQKADRKRKAPKTTKPGAKAKRAKYKEKPQQKTLQKKKKKKEDDPDWRHKSIKNAKKLVNKTSKKPKAVRKSHIAALRDKAKVEKILKSYVAAYKQGKKNLLYKLLKNGLHLKDKKLLKNGFYLKDKKLLKNGALSADKKKPKVVGKKTK